MPVHDRGRAPPVDCHTETVTLTSNSLHTTREVAERCQFSLGELRYRYPTEQMKEAALHLLVVGDRRDVARELLDDPCYLVVGPVEASVDRVTDTAPERGEGGDDRHGRRRHDEVVLRGSQG